MGEFVGMGNLSMRLLICKEVVVSTNEMMCSRKVFGKKKEESNCRKERMRKKKRKYWNGQRSETTNLTSSCIRHAISGNFSSNADSYVTHAGFYLFLAYHYSGGEGDFSRRRRWGDKDLTSLYVERKSHTKEGIKWKMCFLFF